MAVNKRLNQSRFQLRKTTKTDYSISVENDTKVEDLFKPSYWVQVASRLKVGDSIEVLWDDLSQYVDLLVVAVEGNSARVIPLHYRDINDLLEKTSTTIDDDGDVKPIMSMSDFSLEHKGTIKKWCVTRIADKQEIYEGFETKDQAQKALMGHLKTLKAA